MTAITALNQERLEEKGNNEAQLLDIDYVEFYVGNAFQAAHFYASTFGLPTVARAGLETGARDSVSFLTRLNEIRMIFTSSLRPDGAIAEHVRLHGDSVKDIAFRVRGAAQAFESAVRRGARPVMEPTVYEDEDGRVVKATIAAFGDTVHSFIERDAYRGDAFFPQYRKHPSPLFPISNGLLAFDHIAVSVEAGKLDRWVDFYREVLGFHQSHQEDVSTEYSAMNSKVVQNSTGQIVFPIVEPASGKRKSQIDEYLSFHCGPGAQHIALLSSDIVKTVRTLRNNGIEFLYTPDTYYDGLEERIGKLEEDIQPLREQNILVDRDGNGYLKQVFTKPLQSRPTVFMEIIAREGARGFGGGNIKALFDAMEREQALRENL
jgi:4-hydroxyphenylpyruvate dioxygenase